MESVCFAEMLVYLHKNLNGAKTQVSRRGEGGREMITY